MAFTLLLRQHVLPLAGLSTALSLNWGPSVYADEPPKDLGKEIRVRKPIYDSPSSAPEPTTLDIAATTPPVASGITSTTHDSDAATRRPSPEDRLAAEIKRGRLFLHSYAARAEDAVNKGMDRFMSAEHTFTSTIASLAPPKESNEKLLPGVIYVLVATMAGSILARNRNVLIRAATPVATGLVAANYVIPITTKNVGNLIWRFEEQYPVVRDNHVRAQEGITHFVQTGWAHSQMGLAMAQEKVKDTRVAVEDWVRKGR